MNQSNIAGKIATLVALPVLVTIILNIVGAEGFGPFNASETILLVVCSALAVIIFLQAMQSSNKLRTIGIHAALLALFAIVSIVGELRDEPNPGVTVYFSADAALGFFLYIIVHCAVSYIVLATKTLAPVFASSSKSNTRVKSSHKRTSAPLATAQDTFGLDSSDIKRFVLYGIVEYMLVGFTERLLPSFDVQYDLSLFCAYLIPTVLNVVLQVKHSGNQRKTLRIHGILVGIAAATWVGMALVSGAFSQSDSPTAITAESLLVTVATMYWLVSYITLGIVMYTNRQ